jgi:hypothetical protein
LRLCLELRILPEKINLTKPNLIKMTDQKTHWKKTMNPNYLGAYALEPGKDLIATIESVKKEIVKDANGTDAECLVVHLKGTKPFICNKTNAKAISKATGSNYIEDWAGKTIALYIANVRAFGENVEGLRVRSQPATESNKKKKLNDTEFKRLLEAIRNQKFTVDKALDAYEFTKVQMNIILQM